MPRRWAISAAIQTAAMEAPSCSCTPSREARAERSPLCLRASSMAAISAGSQWGRLAMSRFLTLPSWRKDSDLYAVEGGKGGEIALVLKGEFDGGDLGGIAVGEVGDVAFFDFAVLAEGF